METQLKATQGALARAHESIVQIEVQLETERRARQDAEAVSRAEQHACQEAMRLLEATVQPLRDLKTAVAQHVQQAEQQASAYAELEGKYQSIDAQLKEVETSLEGAVELAEQFKLQVEAERLARIDAEMKAYTEQHAHEEAVRERVDAENTAAEQRTLAEEQARAYGELEAIHQAQEAQLTETEASLERATELAEESKLQADMEQRAREDTETQAQAEAYAREQAVRALIDVQNEAEEQRLRSEEQARAQATLEARHRAAEAQLKEMEEALARAEYAAYQHAQRHAQIVSALENERRARETAEAQLDAERRAREAAALESAKTNQSSGFLKKLLRSER